MSAKLTLLELHLLILEGESAFRMDLEDEDADDTDEFAEVGRGELSELFIT